MFFLVSCNREKPALFLGAEKLMPANFSLDKTAKNFDSGHKIYFLFYYPKPFKTDVIRMQILQLTVIMPIDAFSLAMAKDIEIDINDKFVTDNFVIHNEGTYLLRIFTKDNLDVPVIQQEFTVNP